VAHRAWTALFMAAALAGCSRPVRTGALIDRYRTASCIPTNQALQEPPTRSWDHNVVLGGGVTAQISGMQMPGGRVAVRYSPGGEHVVAADAGDYIYPADVRIDPASQHIYVKASGTPAVPIGGPQTWLFEYDLRARHRVGKLRVDPAVLQEECAAAPPPVPEPDAYTIAASGVGAVRLGMTLDSLRKVFPAFAIKRTSDGDGAALVEVWLTPTESVIVRAEEDDPAAPIDWSKTIVTIEAFRPSFHTAQGIHPGSLVADAEKVYGKTKEIVKSEIESREYITFERQPAGFMFRVDKAGVFPERSRRTTQLAVAAGIFSIAVSSLK
jgi:hypothetical protein